MKYLTSALALPALLFAAPVKSGVDNICNGVKRTDNGVTITYIMEEGRHACVYRLRGNKEIFESSTQNNPNVQQICSARVQKYNTGKCESSGLPLEASEPEKPKEERNGVVRETTLVGFLYTFNGIGYYDEESNLFGTLDQKIGPDGVMSSICNQDTLEAIQCMRFLRENYEKGNKDPHSQAVRGFDVAVERFYRTDDELFKKGNDEQ